MTTARGRDTTTVIYRTTSCCGKVFRITKPTPRSLHHAQSYTFAKQKRNERNKYVIMDRGSVQKSERHTQRKRDSADTRSIRTLGLGFGTFIEPIIGLYKLN